MAYSRSGYTTPSPISDLLSGSRRYRKGSLESAALGRSDPFGLASPDSVVGNQQFGGQFASRAPARSPQAPQAPPVVQRPVVAPQATPTVSHAYDLGTDPALQQVQALTGMSDEQANAAALKQRKQLLLQYGDAGLAQSVLGADPTVEAAGQNPFSTIAQLGGQRDRNLHDLTEGLNQSNLLYSGYRVSQEEQAAKDYQDALAQAAAGVNSGLDQISGNLSGALGSNQAARIQAMQDAQQRAEQAALQQGYGDQLAALQDSLANAFSGQSGENPLLTPGDPYTTPSITGETINTPQEAAASGLPIGTPIVDPGFYANYQGGPEPAPTGTVDSLAQLLSSQAPADDTQRQLQLLLAQLGSGTRNFMA